MKKLFLISMAATAMLAGCSNDETLDVVQNNNAIDFASFVDKSTKATDTNLSNLGSIEVYGWRGDTQIFDAQQVTVATDGKGTYSPTQYWDAGYTYSFEAYAPYNNSNVSIAAAKTGGTITFTNDAVTDLLYSGVVTKETFDNEQKPVYNPGAVAFTFNHLLSRVKFTFTNGFPEDAIAKISVTNVKISNAYKTGKITPASTSNAAWDVTGSENLEVTFASTDVTNLASEADEDEGIKKTEDTEHKYLIPASNPSYALTFTVTLDQNGATSTYNHSITITTSMEMGKSYNFVATLSPENIDPAGQKYPIEFTASVSDWGNWSDTNIPESTGETEDEVTE
ncbi:MAG: fimbrillin family protein [Bacteroides sp.]